MAGRGPAPKTRSARPRDEARRHGDKTVLPADGYHGPAPTLPPRSGKQRWIKATQDWWELWRCSPQAATFGPTDWQFLAETAYIADAFFRGELSLAAELRLRVGKLGATPEDRLRLRMEFGEAEVGGQQPAAARSDDDRRRRLTAVNDA